MKQALQILSGAFIIALGLLVGFLWLADLSARGSTAAPVNSAVEVASFLLFLFGFVGSIACTVGLGILLACAISLAFEKQP